MLRFASPYSSKLLTHTNGDRVAYRDYLQTHEFVSEAGGSIARVEYAIERQSREIIANREQLAADDFDIKTQLGQLSDAPHNHPITAKSMRQIKLYCSKPNTCHKRAPKTK